VVQKKARARELRTRAPEAERIMWHHLRNRQLCGFKFRRQMPIQGYFADFACVEAKLIVELDGGQHADQTAYDAKRTEMLGFAGYRVLRFWNNAVMTELGDVLDLIARELQLAKGDSASFG
jgi:very-short-patch-repair endonuclease